MEIAFSKALIAGLSTANLSFNLALIGADSASSYNCPRVEEFDILGKFWCFDLESPFLADIDNWMVWVGLLPLF